MSAPFLLHTALAGALEPVKLAQRGVQNIAGGVGEPLSPSLRRAPHVLHALRGAGRHASRRTRFCCRCSFGQQRS